MKIGIVGSGRIGGLVEQAGGDGRSGTPEQAVAFGDVVLMSVPFAALPEYGRTMTGALGRKVVLDTSNPNPGRDGPMAEEVRRSGRGTGPYLRGWFPGVRLVRAFNTVWDRTLEGEAHRAGPRVGIPLASDDAEALLIAAALVEDAGFDAVIVGPLDRSRDFDVGAPVYDTGMSGPEVRETLGLPAA